MCFIIQLKSHNHSQRNESVLFSKSQKTVTAYYKQIWPFGFQRQNSCLYSSQWSYGFGRDADPLGSTPGSILIFAAAVTGAGTTKAW